MKKLLGMLGLALAVVAVPTAAPARAGGWAVTTLDPLATPVAGEPFDVGLTIRQHGVEPVAVDDVVLVVTDNSGTSTEFAATAEGPVGHYVAPVEFPADGSYTWSVVQGWFGPQDLGTVQVGPATAPGVSDDPADERWPMAWRVVLPVAALALSVVAVRDLRRRSLLTT